jgi:hypothetical protein
MKIYLAGVPGGGSPGNACKRERELELFYKARLHSYYHILITKGIIMKTNKIDLFLDSGAFSAFTQNVEIDIQEYIKFIKEHEDCISVYANLDVIGSAEGTWENQMIMEKAGLKPLPVYHFKEPVKWLLRYLDKGYDYIALGGLVKAGNILPFLDETFTNYLCGSSGIPKIKVHGFGLTSLKLMLRYPWYSVDSTSWVLTGRMGSIFMPSMRGGEFIYDENSWKVVVSNRSPANKEAGKHFTTLTKLEKKVVERYLAEKGYRMGRSEFKKVPAGYELKEQERWADNKPKDKKAGREVEIVMEEGISNKYQLRDEMNIIYFLDLEKSMPEWPWAFRVNHGMVGMVE